MRSRVRRQQTKEERKKARSGNSLHEIGLKESTLRRYREAVHKALEEWDFTNADYTDLVSFDLELGDYLEYLYESGESVSLAGDLISGLQTFLPFLRKHLSYSWHLFGLWRKNERSWQATPMGEELLWAMISRAIDLQWLEMSFVLAAGYFGLLRTGELLQMRFQDITYSAQVLLIHLPESKTAQRGGPGETVVVRDTRVCHLLRTLQLLSKGKHLIWPYTAQLFRERFGSLTSFFCLDGYGYRPYSLRRGGATALYRDQTPMDLILIRGRWKNSSSAHLYISDGMAEWARLKYPRKVRALLRFYHKKLGFESS